VLPEVIVMVLGWPAPLVVAPIVVLTCGKTQVLSVNVGQRWSTSDGLTTA
jgi:hypothetical protein